jgi:hypothetical protein
MSIATPIRGELREPEISVSSWHRSLGASRVLMPVAAVDKDRPSPSLVRKVWRARQPADVQAIREAEFPQESSNYQLASRASLTHTCHECAARRVRIGKPS